MTHKERMRRALDHQSVDRIPTQINYTAAMGTALTAHLGVLPADLTCRLDNHLLRLDLTHPKRLCPDGKISYDWGARGGAPRQITFVNYAFLLIVEWALAGCRQGRKVRFWTAAGLVNELQQAQDEHRLTRFSAAALKLDLVVLDELGFIPFALAAAQLLFTFYAELHERVAVIVTSNLKFADWIPVFGQERLTAALFDRFTAKAHILELLGESFRFRQRLQREARPAEAGTEG